MLENLTNIEYAAKMLLGALYRQDEMNPIDYVHNAVNMLIEPMDSESPEYEVIKTHIDNTRTNRESYDIANIFKV